jgi:hypothetical protein
MVHHLGLSKISSRVVLRPRLALSFLLEYPIGVGERNFDPFLIESIPGLFIEIVLHLKGCDGIFAPSRRLRITLEFPN